MNRKNIVILVILLVIFGVPVLGMLTGGNALRREISPMAVRSEMGGMTGAAVGMPAPAFDMAQTEAGSTMSVDSDRVMKSSVMPPFPGNDGFVAGEDRAIVKTANISAIVEDVRKAVDETTALAKAANGYVTSTNISDANANQTNLMAYLTLRVPADSLDDTLAKIRGLSTQITNENITASDQTKQKLDIDAQLRNQKATEEQLMSIMKQAKTVSETLQVQQQLTQVRQQIEMLEAQQQNLNTNVAMSTITVNFATKAADVTYKQDSLVDEVKVAVRNAMRVYRNLFIAGIRIGVILIPVLVIVGLIWLIARRKNQKTN